MVATVMVVMLVMVIVVNMVVMVDRTGQDRTKQTFKLDFLGNLWLSWTFTILAMFFLSTMSHISNIAPNSKD